MALFASTITEKRENAGTPVHSNGVYTRTLTYTIPAGTVAGSTLDSILVPAGTTILAIYDKASVTLANSATIVYTNAGGTAMVAAAVRAASTVMAGVFYAPTVNTIFTADSFLRVTTATGTIDNASTITLTMICATIDTAPASFTTYTV